MASRAVGGVVRPAARVELDLLQGRDELVRVGREGLAGLEGAVVRDDHAFGVRADRLRDEFLQTFEHPVAVLGLDVLVVDVEDVVGLDDRRHLGRRRLLDVEGNGCAVLEQHLAARDGVEVGDLLGKPVLADLEIVGRQAGDPLALRVGDEDVHVRDGDVDRLADGRNGRRLLLGLRRGRGRRGRGRQAFPGRPTRRRSRAVRRGTKDVSNGASWERKALSPATLFPAAAALRGRRRRAAARVRADPVSAAFRPPSGPKNSVALFSGIQQNSALRRRPGASPGAKAKERRSDSEACHAIGIVRPRPPCFS